MQLLLYISCDKNNLCKFVSSKCFLVSITTTLSRSSYLPCDSTSVSLPFLVIVWASNIRPPWHNCNFYSAEKPVKASNDDSIKPPPLLCHGVHVIANTLSVNLWRIQVYYHFSTLKCWSLKNGVCVQNVLLFDGSLQHKIITGNFTLYCCCWNVCTN